MVPAQASIGLDHEIKPEIAAKPDGESANGGDYHEAKDNTSVRCMNNCEDNTFDSGLFSDQHNLDDARDMEVDILECVDNIGIGSARADDPNATEYSSSFGDTLSGSDNISNLIMSDAEVESQFRDENGHPTVSDRAFRMRKRKLTAHWRNYIRPLMWRCKWMELRMKEFQYQALKYDIELAALNQAKQFKVGQVASESYAARLVPLSNQNHRKKAMRRRKRKRIEETIDISSYMSHHSLFSYYENKKFEADGVSVDDDCGNQVIAAEQNIHSADEFGINCEWSELEFRDGDDSLEKVLWNIDVLQSRVLKLKTQLNKVVFRNAGKSSSTENLSLFMPSELPTSSARSPTFSPGNGDVPVGGFYTPPQHITEFDLGALIIPESAVSSYGEAATLPDIIESTVGLLSDVDAYCDQPQIGDACQDIVDEVLIDNHAVEEEQNFEKVSQLIENPLELVKEEQEKESITPLALAPEVGLPLETVPAPEAGPPLETLPAQEVGSALETVLEPKPHHKPETVPAPEPSSLRYCLASEFRVPKNKRKRADRRAGLGGWNVEKIHNLRTMVDPDNQ